MIRRRPDSGWCAAALAAALFAVTLNLLQPVAHAALMRVGAPSALWSVFCKSATANPDETSGSLPAGAAQDHECCLGLAHARTLIEPPTNFLPVVFDVLADAPPSAAERPTSTGIRDGPHRLRSPPSLV